MSFSNPIILFDGICNLCSRIVGFLIKSDSKKQFRYAAIQSETGKKLSDTFLIPEGTDSVILIWNETVYTESEAVAEIARLLPFPWKIAVICKILPVKLRNRLYRFVAKNRFRWFGKRDKCRVPTDDEKLLFI